MTERNSYLQRRPPDVEEALSSMLWTPYERTPTDSSSEDDDERLNKKLRQLPSSYDYRSVPPPPSFVPLTASYFGADDDLPVAADAPTVAPHAATPFVPFSNLIFSGGSVGGHEMDAYQKSAADTPAHSFRYSYPYYGPIPSLHKWWSSSSTVREPPSYESLYASSATSMSLQPMLHNLQTTIATISSSRVEQFSASDNWQAPQAGCGRLMHSFTDDFISQNLCSLDVAQPPKLNVHSSPLSEAQQNEQVSSTYSSDVTPEQAQTASMRHQRLVNLPAHVEHAERAHEANAGSQQSKENDNNNNNDSSNGNCIHHAQQQQPRQMQVAYVAESAAEARACENKETPDTTNREQVNQLASSVGQRAAAAMNSRTTSGTTTAATTTTTASGSSSSCSLTAQPMNSTTPTMNVDSYTPSCGRERHDCSAALQAPAPSAEARARKISITSSLNECATSPFPWSRKTRAAQVDNTQTHTSGGFVVADSVLTPNKCLAELERLYAEFRASEALIERDTPVKMRLNVPASGNAASASATGSGNMSTSKILLTTTNSVTTNANSANGSNNNHSSCNNNNNNNSNHNVAGSNNNNNSTVAILTANPCQRQPSLTIQVNNNNNNNDNNNVSIATPKPEQQASFLLNQSFCNNNGVSVVNCNYVRSTANNNTSNNNNNNNNAPEQQSSVSVSGSCFTPSATSSVNVNSSSSVPKVFSSECSVAKKSSSGGSDVASSAPVQSKINGKASVHIISVSSAAPTFPASVAGAAAVGAISPNCTPSRTFTSTECQTDDISPPVQMRAERPTSGNTNHNNNNNNNNQVNSSREQRRRERRERRHLQHSASLMPPPTHRRIADRHSMPLPPMPHMHPSHMHHAAASPTASMPAALSAMLRPMLPDILHSHFPPPYSALPLGAGGGGPPPLPPPPLVRPPPPPPPAPGTTLLTPVISTVPIPGSTAIVGDGRFTLPLPIIRRSPSERSGKGCCGQWFAGPPLRALIAVVALGGVACALGGAALGATGLAGPPSSHLTAALLMIGVGVVLVTISGAAWRMTAPGGPPCLGLGSSVDLGRCGRRPCSRGGGAPHGLLYPEFQHRPPPPSYQASMQEYRLRLLLLDRDRQNGVVRGNSPPPTYRSHAGSLLRAPLTTTIRGGGSSSIGGSEYSLPPSYRSRNDTPATLCIERSIETAPSGRLLANEDIPEPLSAETLPNYSSLSSTAAHTPKTTTAACTTTQITTTAAVVEIETSPFDGSERKANAKFNPRIFNSKHNGCDSKSSIGGKDLVTIVTISQQSDDEGQVRSETRTGANAAEQIEILAHL